mgnify:CR=1 FL=1
MAASLKAQMAAEVATFEERYGRVPHLAVILVGEDPGSVSYVTGKAKAATEIGIRNTTLRYPDTITEKELLDVIAELNANEDIDGILVQLPLPKHIDEDKVIKAIAVEKDVDAFHPGNVGRVLTGNYDFVPCTPAGVMELLAHYGIDPAGKTAVISRRYSFPKKVMRITSSM